jgi:NAD+ synthase
MSKKLTILLAQLNPVVGDIEGNIKRARHVLDKTPPRTDLMVLSELFVCGYSPEDLILKPSFLEKIENSVHAFARTVGDTAVLLPCPWRQEGKIYNAVHLIEDGKIQATRFKHHLPNYGVFDEHRIFTSGPLPEPIPFHDHKLGVMICEDVWYSDVARHLKDKGADILIVLNASPFEAGKLEQRLDTGRTRVMETGLPLIYVNQTGGQDDIVFDGASFILNEKGDCILRAEEFAEDIIHTSWEQAATGHWLCAAGELKHHRQGPELIYQAAMTGLRDYVTKNGFPGVILGMSGGIDSALSAALATDALGPDMVRCVMLPSVYTSQDSLDDAAACCALLGVSLDTISITDPVRAFEETLAHHFTGDTPGIVHENIQSRARGIILMALSNATGRMVLTTGNKSEMATGYATLYGDMCGGFNALKDIYKTDIFALAQWRNGNRPDHAFGSAGPVIPDMIINRPPTAELKPNQTDQDTLPPYDRLDDILRGLIEDDLSESAIAARGHDPETVARVRRMLDLSEYKRRQSAPGVKITPRAFGRERRYPMTNDFRE